MLLQYAFEKLHMLRVQIKTDARNEKAQRAIERLGALKEGVLRNEKKITEWLCERCGGVQYYLE